MTRRLYDRLALSLSGRYELERDVGHGALAVVYLAEDVRHRRRVAVKVLRPEVSAGMAPARFQREIEIVAGLHHPHILPLFDSGDVDGLVYFTMPYVERGSLRHRLEETRVLPIAESLRIARQVASALSYAQARGVVHRDIKPENMLLSDGGPQVADFGIARFLSHAETETITEAGIAIGTPTYMSPEQADSGARVDGRTDLYSLGCVLYEMLAGEPPFAGPSRMVIMARHATAPVPSIRTARPTVPLRLERAIQRALAKEPADRHASLAEFAAELAEIEVEARAGTTSRPRSTPRNGHARAAGPRGGSRDRPGVLVLPFLQLTALGDHDFVSDGLADELITRLSGLEAVRVISHTSAMQLKGTRKGARELGEDLNVDYVLEGSVQSADQALRVATRLVRTDTEELVWSNSYEGLIEDLFELEKKIASAVVDGLSLRLSGGERQRLAEPRIADMHAMECYLRARREVYTFTASALDRALGYLKQGATILGDNVTILAAMGYVYWQYVNAGISADPSYFARARECAERIRQLDPSSPEADRLLGLIEIHERGDPQVAVIHLRRALDSNPNDPDALFWLALIYGCVGRPSSGYALAIRLLDIDPLTPLHHVVPGFLDVLDGDPQRALPWLAEAHEMEPANPITSVAYGQALAMAGRSEAAAAVLEEIAGHVPEGFLTSLGRVYSRALRGRKDEALEAITTDVTENAAQDLQYSWTLAQCYALLDEPAEATRWLENAVRQGFWNYPLLAERDPLLAPLRGRKDFEGVMSEAKKRWMNFEA